MTKNSKGSARFEGVFCEFPTCNKRGMQYDLNSCALCTHHNLMKSRMSRRLQERKASERSRSSS